MHWLETTYYVVAIAATLSTAGSVVLGFLIKQVLSQLSELKRWQIKQDEDFTRLDKEAITKRDLREALQPITQLLENTVRTEYHHLVERVTRLETMVKCKGGKLCEDCER